MLQSARANRTALRLRAFLRACLNWLGIGSLLSHWPLAPLWGMGSQRDCQSLFLVKLEFLLPRFILGKLALLALIEEKIAQH